MMRGIDDLRMVSGGDNVRRRSECVQLPCPARRTAPKLNFGQSIFVPKLSYDDLPRKRDRIHVDLCDYDLLSLRASLAAIG